MKWSYDMSEKIDIFKKLIYSLLAMIIVLSASTGLSYAGSKTLGIAGETGYSLVKNVEQEYLTSEAGRFHVLDTTKILDQNASKIKLSDIKRDFLADIRYVTINGEPTALEIVAKIESKKEEFPK